MRTKAQRRERAWRSALSIRPTSGSGAGQWGTVQSPVRQTGGTRVAFLFLRRAVLSPVSVSPPRSHSFFKSWLQFSFLGNSGPPPLLHLRVNLLLIPSPSSFHFFARYTDCVICPDHSLAVCPLGLIGTMIGIPALSPEPGVKQMYNMG